MCITSNATRATLQSRPPTAVSLSPSPSSSLSVSLRISLSFSRNRQEEERRRERERKRERIRSAESERRLWPVIHSRDGRVKTCRSTFYTFLAHVYMSYVYVLLRRQEMDEHRWHRGSRKKAEIDRCVADPMVVVRFARVSACDKSSYSNCNVADLVALECSL